MIFTYYFAGLLKIILDASKSIGFNFNSSLVVALLLPLLAYAVWRIVRYAKHDLRSGE